jgi:hypothetical protein
MLHALVRFLHHVHITLLVRLTTICLSMVARDNSALQIPSNSKQFLITCIIVRMLTTQELRRAALTPRESRTTNTAGWR